MAANAQPAAEAPKRRWLTPGESARMDQRIKELSQQRRTGTEIRDALNAEFEVSFSREAYYKRVRGLDLQWLKLPSDRPTCNRVGCPRFGKTMALYYTHRGRFKDRPEEERTVQGYTCRPKKPVEPHHCYIWLETGEQVRRTDRGKFEFADGAVTTDGLSLRWQNDEGFRRSQLAVIQETANRDDVREKRRATGRRRHKEDPTFMPKIAKIHLEVPEVNTRWLKAHRHGITSPEARANMREGQKRALAVPGYLEKRNAAIRGGHARRTAEIDSLKADAAKVAEAERAAIEARRVADEADRRVVEARQRLEDATRAAQGSDERLAHAIDEVLPRFQRLFASPEVKANPKILIRHGCKLPDYSLDMITAAGGAVENSRRPKHWPKYAAISFVATTGNRERKSVQRAYDRFHAS